MKVVVAILAVLTVVAVGIGIWFFVRDEYPFQVGDGDVAAVTYEYRDQNVWVSGTVTDPPDDLAGWISGWERDASGESPSTDSTVTIILRDGRRLRLNVGGKRGYGSWVGADGRSGPSLGVHFNDAFVWYVRGLGDGFGGGSAAVPGEPPPPAPSPSLSP